MRRTVIVIASAIAFALVLGYLAHTFDLIEFIRSTHGSGPAEH